jgi:DNA topoisomerase-1
MEELGIGRPSTYASIVSTIQEREYVRKEQNRLFPEDKGRIVTIFLLNFFKKYVEYDFTAALENQLDNVSAGEQDYKEVLHKFWRDFSAAISETSELRITEVLDVLDDALAPQLYPPREDGSDPEDLPTVWERAATPEIITHWRFRWMWELSGMYLYPTPFGGCR